MFERKKKPFHLKTHRWWEKDRKEKDVLMLENQKCILKEFFINGMCRSFGCLDDFVREVGCLWGRGVGGFGYMFLCDKESFLKFIYFRRAGKQ